MIEIELKALVPDLDGLRRKLALGGTELVFEGELDDRRYDTIERRLLTRDEVLRLRIYRGAGRTGAQLDWKGPTSISNGYKRREEITTAVGAADTLAEILDRLGYVVTMAIDRQIWEYEIAGATVRLERYPHMDDLIEVEGSAENIERAIERLDLPRSGFTGERLRDFVRRFEERTGERAVLSTAARVSGADFDTVNA